VPKTIPDKGQECHPRCSVGGTPFENLIVDNTGMPQARRYKYLLVFVCTFSGRVKAFPTQSEKAQK
jgi:hypothetical protein